MANTALGETSAASESREDSTESTDNDQIIYLPLGFDTELPYSSSSYLPGTAGSPAADLQPPNLKKYGSPYNWPICRKVLVTAISCTCTMLSSFAVGSYGPAVQQLTSEWKVSVVAASIGITTFTAGFALGPMVLSPISEIHGRKPVFLATAVLFAVCEVCTAVTRIYAGMLVARFFVGVGCSTFSTMVGGIIADIYHSKTRNAPMCIFAGLSLFGAGLGQITCSLIAEHTTWRWVFYMQSIMAGLACLMLLLFVSETRSTVILRRKANRLNAWQQKLEEAGYQYHCNYQRYCQRDHPVSHTESEEEKEKQLIIQRIRWIVPEDEGRAGLAQLISTSLFRPFRFLFTEPVVFFFSLWMAFSWAVLYINISAIPMVFQSRYNFTLAQANAVMTSECAACILGSILFILQDYIAKHKLGWSKNPTPEHRLYFSCVESFLLPIGLFMFGWTSEYGVHWIVPTIAVGIFTIGIFSIYLAVFNYLADIYHHYASSAISAQGFCRNMLGGAFPLISRQLFRNIGFGPAGSLLGGITVLLCVVPWVLVFFGQTIRAKSKWATSMNKDTKDEEKKGNTEV